MRVMEPVIDYLKRHLRSAGHHSWPAIAAAVSDGMPEDRRIGYSLLRKIAYGDRDNPGVQTVQPLLDYFGAIERGERSLPSAEAIAAAAAARSTESAEG